MTKGEYQRVLADRKAVIDRQCGRLPCAIALGGELTRTPWWVCLNHSNTDTACAWAAGWYIWWRTQGARFLPSYALSGWSLEAESSGE